MRRFACTLGLDTGDCGPAALATVVRQHGGGASLARVRALARTDGRGTDFARLLRAAESLGLEAVCGLARPGAEEGMPLPAIIHFGDENGHFAVMHKVERGRALIADPAIGLAWMGRDELERRWDRRVLLLRPTAALARDGREGHAWRPAFEICRKEGRWLALCLALSALVSGGAFGMSVVAEVVFDRFLPNPASGLLLLLGLAAVALVFAGAAGSAVRAWTVIRLGVRVELRLGHSFAKRVFGQGLEFFANATPGDVYSRFADAASVRAALTGTVLTLAMDLVTLLVCFTALAWLSLPLTLAALPAFAAGGVCAAGAGRPMMRAERRARQMASFFAEGFVDWVANIRAVKASYAEQDVLSALASAYTRSKEAGATHALIFQLTGAAITAVAGLGTAGVLLFGAYLAAHGRITPGDLVLFFFAVGLALNPIHHLARSLAAGQAGLVGLERLQAAAPEPPPVPVERPAGDWLGGIEARAVQFLYAGSISPALRNISVQIEPGETLGVVGPSGSGKTTLALLLAGLVEPTGGDLLARDAGCGAAPLRWVRRSIALAAQEPGLTSATVRENIALGSPQASMEEIAEAAGLAGADAFIRALPLGYEQRLGTVGGRLSSGQRQRIGLARALLRDPVVLILDEATNAVEPGMDAAIVERILRARRGRATVLVTHRAQLAEMADRVLFLRDGCLQAQGPHSALLGSHPDYALLWESPKAVPA